MNCAHSGYRSDLKTGQLDGRAWPCLRLVGFVCCEPDLLPLRAAAAAARQMALGVVPFGDIDCRPPLRLLDGPARCWRCSSEPARHGVACRCGAPH